MYLAFLEDWVRQTTELESTTKLFVYALAEFADNQTGGVLAESAHNSYGYVYEHEHCSKGAETVP